MSKKCATNVKMYKCTRNVTKCAANALQEMCSVNSERTQGACSVERSHGAGLKGKLKCNLFQLISPVNVQLKGKYI